MPGTNTKYSVLWETEPQFRGWLTRSDKKDGATRAKCIWCNSDFSVANGGKRDVMKHMKTDQHTKNANAKVAQKSVVEFRGEKFLLIFKISIDLLDFMF